MHLKNLEISAFRGINKPIKLVFDGKSLLLVGPNGFGKTSILQAIEWGLLGGVGLLEGTEFRREDALVSLFNEDGIAKVEMAVEDEKGVGFELLRKRKRLSRTRGGSSLILNLTGQTFKTRNAEAKLAELLKFSPEEYDTTIHLHQEVIRQLVEGNEKERSRAINRILGIDLLSDFGDIVSKHLHSASVINRSFRGLQKIVDQLSVQRKTIGETKTNEESALENAKARLMEKGIKVDKLEEAVNSSLTEIKQATVEVAKELALDKLISRILRLEVPIQNMDKAGETMDKTKDAKRELASTLQRLVSEAKEDVLQLELLEKQHNSFLNQLLELKIEKLDVGNEIDAAGSELAGLESQLKPFREKESLLKDLKEEVERIQRHINELSSNINEIIENRGDESALEQKQGMLSEQEETLNRDLERLGTYNNLLNLALDYIEATKKDICPVCEHPIEYESVLTSIRKRLSKEILKHMEELRQRLKKTKEEGEKIIETLRDFKRLKTTLEDHIEKLSQTKKEFLEITEIELVEPFSTSIENQITALREQIAQYEQKIDEAKTRLSDLKRAQLIVENLDKVEEKIKENTGVQETDKQLLIALRKRIRSKKGETDTLVQMQEKIVKLDEKINLIEDIISFLRRSTTLKSLQKSLDETDQKLMVQQDKLQKLQELLEGLSDIQYAVNAVKMEALEDILSAIRQDLNDTYSRLSGHPLFVELQLVPEEERGTQIYRLAARSKDGIYGTYVRTRFSQAQRNLVAISLFLSMAKRAHLGLVILDDPSQSLDAAHKKALVEVLKGLMDEVQVIVATQDENFADQMLQSVPSDKMTAHGLSSWSEDGPIIQIIR